MATSYRFGDKFQMHLDKNGKTSITLHADAAGIVAFDLTDPFDGNANAGRVSAVLKDAAGTILSTKYLTSNTSFKASLGQAGDYTLTLGDVSYSSDSVVGDYGLSSTLTSVKGATYDSETNNTSLTATPTLPGAPIIGAVTGGDYDYFKVHASTAGEFTIDFTHPDGIGNSGHNISVTLLDTSGNILISRNMDGSEKLLTTIASSGDYLLRLQADSYAFTENKEYSVVPTISYVAGVVYDGAANNASNSALPVAPGQHIVGTLNSSDTDYFKLQTSSAGFLSLDFSHPDGIGRSSNTIGFELTDSLGNLVTSTTLRGDAHFETTVPSAGEYGIKISGGYSASDMAHTYQLDTGFSYIPGAIYDGAANNNSLSAIKAPLGSPIIGSLETNDTDFFKVTLPAGMASVNFIHPNGIGTSGQRVSFQLLDASGKIIVNDTLTGNKYLEANIPTAGDYYLRVAENNYGDFGGHGNYMLVASAGPQKVAAGTPGNDDRTSSAGNDVIAFGAGTDTMHYHGAASNYTTSHTDNALVVSDRSGVDGTDTLFDAERLMFSDTALAFDMTGAAGQSYRLYQAAFDRKPDLPGLGYWIGMMDRGASLKGIAAGFVNSAEFQALYGATPANRDVVNLLYQHILHRAPDAAGANYWVEILDRHQDTVAGVLASFGESAENQAQVIGSISNGIHYTPFPS